MNIFVENSLLEEESKGVMLNHLRMIRGEISPYNPYFHFYERFYSASSSLETMTTSSDECVLT